MRHSKLIISALIVPFLANFAAAGNPVASPSFDDLFGIGESEAIEVFGAETARCLSDALEDFNLALSGKNPQHSKSPAFPQVLDGGTTFWEGACYKLTILKQLTTYRLADGTSVNGFVVGPSLQLQLSPNASKSQPIARTRFAFIEKRAAN
jgi:hypothetical protein